MSQVEPRVPSSDDLMTDALPANDGGESDLPLYAPPRAIPRLTDPRPEVDDQVARGGSPDLFVIAANRMGYGPVPGQKAEWNALGGTEEARFDAYISQQLDPDAIVDTDYESRRAASGYVTLNKSLHDLWVEYERDLGGVTLSNDPQEECELDWFLRAVSSKKQLEHAMTEFWVDHFNVYSRESPTDSLWPNWVNMLRSNAFGNFRTLLGQTAMHPAMLYYLDQYTSEIGGPNENYCRELFELHTLGADNYLGVQSQVSVGSSVWASYAAAVAALYDHPNGIPDGYVDNDVFQAAQAFAGWTFEFGDGATAGEFFFNEASHSNIAQMTVLGFAVTNIPSTLAMPLRAEKVLDLLAYHPGTARHVCTKLVRHFVQDDPPQGLVDSAMDLFFQQRLAPDQLKQVMQHILTSTEFRNSFGAKLKRPFHLTVSILRATETSLDWSLDGNETNSFLGRFGLTGHRPFRWRPPNGYPDVREKWETASPRVMSWRLGQWLARVENNADEYYMDINARTPGSVDRTPNALVDYWIDRIFPQGVSTVFREEVVDYLAQGFNPDNFLNLTDSSTEQRLQMMISLLMATPEFCER